MKFKVYALLGFVCVCLFVFMFVSVFFIYFSGPNASSQHLQYFGQVGDFFGGMLNPILAFASFIALLYTIRIQSEELKLTREEFQKSVKAQERMASEAKNQTELTLRLEGYRFAAAQLRSECSKIEAIGEHDISRWLGHAAHDYNVRTINRLIERMAFEFHPSRDLRLASDDICFDRARGICHRLVPEGNNDFNEHIQKYLRSVQNLVRTADVYSTLSKQLSLSEEAGTPQYLDNNNVAKILVSAYILSGVTNWFEPSGFYPITGDGLHSRFSQVLSDYGLGQELDINQK